MVVDRHRDAIGNAPEFSWARAVVATVTSVGIIGLGAYYARTHPNPGYQAGYDAVTTNDPHWPGVTGRTPQSACETLYTEMGKPAATPNYDHDSFVRGCEDAAGQQGATISAK